jgi:hypothetical protein
LCTRVGGFWAKNKKINKYTKVLLQKPPPPPPPPPGWFSAL